MVGAVVPEAGLVVCANRNPAQWPCMDKDGCRFFRAFMDPAYHVT